MKKEVVHAIQDEYPDDFAMCYGCGRLNEAGLHFRTGWLKDKTITIFTPKKEHTAIPGFVYGGILASFIDCHGTGSASLALHREKGHEPGDGVAPPRFVTASLHVDYVKPTPQNVALQAVGTLEKVHLKRWRVFTEVYAEEELCAKGYVEAVVMPDTFA
ncbi:MAG TPA: PaaI family thioesterase [Bacillota bacterium]|nr:PaaI family thioesterase [Bacillota bacterium]